MFLHKIVPDRCIYHYFNPLLRAEKQVPRKVVKCEISQNTIFKYAMGNRFAILIPLSYQVALKFLNPPLEAENQVFS